MGSNIHIFITYILTFLLVPVYHVTKSFISKKGFILFFVALGITISRLLLLDKIPLIFIDFRYLFQSFLLIFIPFLIYFYFKNNFKRIIDRKEYFIKLLPLYFIFGALQQLYFLHVFGDLTRYLLGTNVLTLIIISLYFYIYHLKWIKSDLKNVLPVLFVMSLISTYSYLYLNNSIVQILLHGFFGSYIFTVYSDDDQIKNRLSKEV